MFSMQEGTAPVVDPTTADGVYSLLWLVIALPAAGAAILLIGGAMAPRRFAAFGHLLGCLLPIGSFVLSVIMFVQLLGRDEDDRQVAQHVYDWIQVGGLDVGMDLLYDPLTALFLLGRVLFWIGYHYNPYLRAFGFGITFYPTVAVFLWLILRMVFGIELRI